jgi:hypothetical protein
MEGTILVMQSLVIKWYKHLNQNNMTYCGHFMFAVGHGLTCLKAGFYLIVHGIFPCFYQHAGELVHELEKVFTDREHIIEDYKQNETNN